MMNNVVIRLQDNKFGNPSKGGNSGVCISNVVIENALLEPTYRLLSRYSNLKPSEWKNLGVTVFSAQETGLTNESDGVFEELPVFTLQGDEDPVNSWIDTGNCMGVVRIRDNTTGFSVQMEIASRFDKGNKQYFLNYLLGKVFGGSLIGDIDLGEDTLWDMLLALMFRYRLQEVGRVGLYKQYQKHEFNNHRFRGKLNLDEHMRRNIPFIGRISYTTYDHTFDNPLNHLIRYAIVAISRKWDPYFFGCKRCNDIRHEYVQNTPSWHPARIQQCIKNNLRPIRHPFFNAYYEPLRKIALSVLRDEGASLYGASHEAEGVIFDGSWLWEKYLWTLLEPLGFAHPDNREQSGAWRILGCSFYPDFYFQPEDAQEQRIVLDAKYRHAQRTSDSVSQLLAYMFMLKARHGGLIKPTQDEYLSKLEPITWQQERHGSWHDIFFRIPMESKNASSFISSMIDEESKFETYISAAKKYIC